MNDMCVGVLNPGTIVLATAGKEKNGYYVILKSEGEYVYLGDGKRLGIQKPKKKKLKHIAPTKICDEYIFRKISEGAEVTNKEIKRAISNYLKEN